MNQIGICGHFAKDKDFFDGQTVKTRTIYDELQKLTGGNIPIVDTYGWRKRHVFMILLCLRLIVKCSNIIIMPSRNGVQVFLPLFSVLNRFFHRKLHYVVIGGWLPETFACKHYLMKYAKRFDGIYVETKQMITTLEDMGFHNIYLLPNFKSIKILTPDIICNNYEKPYPLCTFSRVFKEKGIEDAIEAVKMVNQKAGETIYKLDIYGQIEEKYRARFMQISAEFPSYIEYKGIVDYNQSIEIIKKYFLLLFPTYYAGEGLAGTLIDAFAAGVPVIASDWKYNGEIIENNVNGFLFPTGNITKLADMLYQISMEPGRVCDMKLDCLKTAALYSSDRVLRDYYSTYIA